MMLEQLLFGGGGRDFVYSLGIVQIAEEKSHDPFVLGIEWHTATIAASLHYTHTNTHTIYTICFLFFFFFYFGLFVVWRCLKK